MCISYRCRSCRGPPRRQPGSQRGPVHAARLAPCPAGEPANPHACPLNAVTVTVRQRALAVNPNAVVAERRKRLPTILDKLKRHPTMSVTTMQDLGGCRVIFETVAEVDELVRILEGSPRTKNRV